MISSRTPEGSPNRCPVCGADARVEPSDPVGDAPCPQCGHLLWFLPGEAGGPDVVRFAGLLGEPGAVDRLLDRLEARTRAGVGGAVVLDFRDVASLPSETFARLLRFSRRIGPCRPGWTIRADPDLREVFRITRLDRVFVIEGETVG